MTAIHFRFRTQEPSTAELKEARKICSLSLQELRDNAKDRAAILSVEPFASDWEEQRGQLAEIVDAILNQQSPFEACEETPDGLEVLDEALLRNQLSQLRSIELETQKSIDLEEGFIESPEDFEAHDDDWRHPN